MKEHAMKEHAMKDAMSMLEELWQVNACMPPHVPVPQPGPCPGIKRTGRTAIRKATAVQTPRARSRVKATSGKAAGPKTFAVRDARARLDALYGNRMQISGANDEIDGYLADLARIPDLMHERVNKLFGIRETQNRTTDAGIRIGVGSVLDVSPQAKKILENRMASAGRPYSRVGGVFMGGLGQVIIGSQTVGSGSVSRAAHEFGHALDKSGTTIGFDRRAFSAREPWRDAMETVYASPDLLLNPYYTPTGNPGNWLGEAFAESFAAWSKTADEPDRRVKVAAILNTLGQIKAGRQVSPYVIAAVESMIEMFDYLAGR